MLISRSNRFRAAQTLLTAIGTSLVLAYLVTELNVRVFGGAPFALFITASIACFAAFLLGIARGRRAADNESSRQA